MAVSLAHLLDNLLEEVESGASAHQLGETARQLASLVRFRPLPIPPAALLSLSERWEAKGFAHSGKGLHKIVADYWNEAAEWLEQPGGYQSLQMFSQRLRERIRSADQEVEPYEWRSIVLERLEEAIRDEVETFGIDALVAESVKSRARPEGQWWFWESEDEWTYVIDTDLPDEAWNESKVGLRTFRKAYLSDSWRDVLYRIMAEKARNRESAVAVHQERSVFQFRVDILEYVTYVYESIGLSVRIGLQGYNEPNLDASILNHDVRVYGLVLMMLDSFRRGDFANKSQAGLIEEGARLANEYVRSGRVRSMEMTCPYKAGEWDLDNVRWEMDKARLYVTKKKWNEMRTEDADLEVAPTQTAGMLRAFVKGLEKVESRAASAFTDDSWRVRK